MAKSVPQTQIKMGEGVEGVEGGEVTDRLWKVRQCRFHSTYSSQCMCCHYQSEIFSSLVLCHESQYSKCLGHWPVFSSVKSSCVSTDFF